MPTAQCHKMATDRGGRRTGGERRRRERAVAFHDRRTIPDRRHGTDRRSGSERRSHQGFRMLVGLDRRGAFRQPEPALD